jgi:hypothetical protein
MSDELPRVRPPARGLVRVAATALFLVMATASPARAENEAARQFSAGTAAFDRGEFVVAARAFDAADAIAPAPAAVFNAARAWQEAGDRPRAADRWARFLDAAPPDVTERATATRELARLRASLIAARIDGPNDARVTIAHVSDAPVPVVVHLPPGPNVGTWTSGARDRGRFTVDGLPGEQIATTLRLPAPAQGGLMRAPAGERPALSSPASSGGGPDAVAVAGTTFLILGVAAVGVGIGVGVDAVGARDAFVEGGSVDPDLRSQADDGRTASNVMWITGAAVGTLGAILLVASLGGDDDPVVARRGLALRF